MTKRHIGGHFLPAVRSNTYDATILGMRIDHEFERLVWDDWNREHIQKHKVTVDEVEESVASWSLREDTYKGRQQLMGSTANGRMLTVIIGPVPGQPGSFYVFSARPASSQERRRYARARGGGRR